MARPIERFTLGVEEEYRIVDGTTPALAGRQADVLPRAERELGSAVAPEFQQSTIEVATHICSTLAGVRRELERARTRVVSAARERGSRIAAQGYASVFRLARADDYRQAAVSRDRSARSCSPASPARSREASTS